MTIQNVAYAFHNADAEKSVFKYELDEPSENQVIIETHYCGVCKSDSENLKGHYFTCTFPHVGGHEVTGVVCKVGSKVTNVKIGDRVGLGFQNSFCGQCEPCKAGEVNYCPGMTLTDLGEGTDGKKRYGGFGKYVNASAECVVPIPDEYPLDMAAPLMCAGVTTYAGLKRAGAERGNLNVGIIGLGGLGHLAVLFAKAFNNSVYVFSRSESKRDSVKKLGAEDIIMTTDSKNLDSWAYKFDIIFDSICVEDPTPYLNLLKVGGRMHTVGSPSKDSTTKIPYTELYMGGRTFSCSQFGTPQDIKDMMSFCVTKHIMPSIEHIRCDQINEAFERLNKGDVRYRFVMDLRNSLPVDA